MYLTVKQLKELPSNLKNIPINKQSIFLINRVKTQFKNDLLDLNQIHILEKYFNIKLY